MSSHALIKTIQRNRLDGYYAFWTIWIVHHSLYLLGVHSSFLSGPRGERNFLNKPKDFIYLLRVTISATFHPKCFRFYSRRCWPEIYFLTVRAFNNTPNFSVIILITLKSLINFISPRYTDAINNAERNDDATTSTCNIFGGER